jgi:hypothetical protein
MSKGFELEAGQSGNGEIEKALKQGFFYFLGNNRQLEISKEIIF